MAVLITQPVTSDIWFIKNETNTLRPIILEWTDADETASYNVSYSYNSGSNWVSILSATSNTGTTNGTTFDHTYSWIPSATDFTNLLLTATDPLNEYVQIKIEHSDNSALTDTSDTFSIAIVSITDIKPDFNSASLVGGGLPINSDAKVNIVWGEDWASSCNNVGIQYLVAATIGSPYRVDSYDNFVTDWTGVTSIIASATNNYGYVYEFTYVTTEQVNTMHLKITDVDSHHFNNWDVSGIGTNSYANYGFSLTLSASTSTTTDLSEMYDYSRRTEIGSTIAGEKAIMLDEAVLLGQLEAGEGIEIIQRDVEGKLVTGDSVDYKKTHNVVIRLRTENELPRELFGIVDFLTNGLSAGTIEGGDDYGHALYVDIVHNWNLAVEDYYMIEFKGVKESNVEPLVWHYLQHEPIDVNTIRVYYTLKGTDTDPIWAASVDSYVTLAKDRLGHNNRPHSFYYKLKELVI